MPQDEFKITSGYNLEADVQSAAARCPDGWGGVAQNTAHHPPVDDSVETLVSNALLYTREGNPSTEQKALDAIGVAIRRELRSRLTIITEQDYQVRQLKRELENAQVRNNELAAMHNAERTSRAILGNDLRAREHVIDIIVGFFVPEQEGVAYPPYDEVPEYVAHALAEHGDDTEKLDTARDRARQFLKDITPEQAEVKADA